MDEMFVLNTVCVILSIVEIVLVLVRIRKGE